MTDIKEKQNRHNTMKYFAFISYSRADIKVAGWLHKKLEKYPYPQSLVAEENRPPHKKLLRKIFIDIKDLHVTVEEFTAEIRKNLEESRYLIVLCSEHSAKSEFVKKEIEYFLKTHDNNYELILPVFIDKIENNIPEPLSNSDILKRNCPLYNTRLDEKSEANLYCFYHVAAFLLKVDFTKLYNRYESYSKRKMNYKIRLNILFITLLLFSTVFLYISLNRQQALTRFEKNIFPLSVVFGYEKNFLSPAIEYLKKENPGFCIHILMPYSVDDLKHQDRIARAGCSIKEKLKADSIYSEKLPTRMKRGTTIGRIADRQQKYRSAYIDFASTTSTFLQILEYKKEKYPNLDENEVIQDYTDTFIRQTKELLGQDSVFVKFYVSQDKFIEGIKTAGNGN